jgi:hypothetical protein
MRESIPCTGKATAGKTANERKNWPIDKKRTEGFLENVPFKERRDSVRRKNRFFKGTA